MSPMRMENIQGRYPAPLGKQRFVGRVEEVDGDLHVRFDDADNDEFWLEFTIKGVREDMQTALNVNGDNGAANGAANGAGRGRDVAEIDN